MGRQTRPFPSLRLRCSWITVQLPGEDGNLIFLTLCVLTCMMAVGLRVGVGCEVVMPHYGKVIADTHTQANDEYLWRTVYF